MIIMKVMTANSNKTAAKVFGLFFILAFVAYGGGSALAESIAGSQDGLAGVYKAQASLTVSVILMALVHTFLNIGLVVIMFPILKPYSSTVAYGYLSAAIMATLMLVVGAVFLLLLVPASIEFTKAGDVGTGHLEGLAAILRKAHFYFYQMGMTVWGLGGLMLTYLLYQSKKVPRAIAVWGFAGYIVFIAGTIFELFGYKIGLLLDIPGGLFELFLSVWLLVKGFSTKESVAEEKRASYINTQVNVIA
jgi:hypothetical protein